jgi:RNA polymerase sigma-70 factor (ECF subfamily)
MISKVKTLLDGLPTVQRQALEMAYFEGLSQSEIARRTGEPLGTIKTRLRTALGLLKRTLNP